MRLTLAATVLCLAAAACGGGDDTGGQPSTSPSATSAAPTPSAMAKADYVTAVNAVCKDVLSQAEAIADPVEVTDYVTSTERYIGILEAGQAKLRALEPPAEDKAKATEFVDANEQQIQILRDLLPSIRASAEKGDKDAVEAEFAAGFERFNEIAEEQAPWANQYGLTECT